MIMTITIERTSNLATRGEPLNNNTSLGNKTSPLGNISIITPWNTGNDKNNSGNIGYN